MFGRHSETLQMKQRWVLLVDYHQILDYKYTPPNTTMYTVRIKYCRKKSKKTLPPSRVS
jgi:hypothetical protein